MSLSKTVLKNVLVSFTGRIYTGVLTFVVVALLLPRVLTQEGFGVYAFYSTFFVILGVIVDFGSNVIAVREGSKEPSRLGGKHYACIGQRRGYSPTLVILQGVDHARSWHGAIVRQCTGDERHLEW